MCCPPASARGPVPGRAAKPVSTKQICPWIKDQVMLRCSSVYEVEHHF